MIVAREDGTTRTDRNKLKDPFRLSRKVMIDLSILRKKQTGGAHSPGSMRGILEQGQ